MAWLPGPRRRRFAYHSAVAEQQRELIELVEVLVALVPVEEAKPVWRLHPCARPRAWSRAHLRAPQRHQGAVRATASRLYGSAAAAAGNRAVREALGVRDHCEPAKALSS